MWVHDIQKQDHKKSLILDYWMKDKEIDKIKVNTNSSVPESKQYTKINNLSGTILSKKRANSKK